MNPVSEDKLLQILRVEEPLTIADLNKRFPDAMPSQMEEILFDLLEQNRVSRCASEGYGELWYFGGTTGGTPTRTLCSQAELAAMAQHCKLVELNEGKPMKLYYHDGNPYLITGTLSRGAEGFISVNAQPALPQSIAGAEPVRKGSPATQYLGVRFKVGKEIWVGVSPHITFTLQQENEPMTTKSKNFVGDPSGFAAAIGVNTTPAEFKELPLNEIVADKQIRRFFDPVKLEELAASIRERGVDSPILVRPMDDGKYHIIAGERRYRASLLAEKATIPAIIKIVDDATALEMQVEENEQRENLHPLEAAEGYKALMNARGESVKELAFRVGKSEKFIYQRLRLLQLPQVTQEALWNGGLTFAQALQIATLENADDQKEATKTFLDDRWDNFRTEAKAARYIRENFFTLLSTAKFDPKDASLVPAVGACTTCTKHTGAADQALLFEAKEFAKKDTCLDRACFKSKTAAFVQIEVKKAKDKGLKVLSAKEVKEVMPYHGTSLHGSKGDQYVRLDDTVHEDNQNRTWRQLLGKSAKITIAEKDGNLVYLADKKSAREALKQLHPEVTVSRSADPKQAEANRKIEDAKRARKMVVQGLLAALKVADRSELDNPNGTELRRLFARIALREAGTDSHRLLRRSLNLGDPKDNDHTAVLTQHLNECDDPLLLIFQILVVEFLDSWVGWGGDYAEELRKDLYKAIGFDFKAQMKAAEKAVADSRKQKSKKGDN